MPFTAPVDAALHTRHYNASAIQEIFIYYSDNYVGVPGAPKVEDLTIDEAEAAAHLSVFKTEKHTDWAGLVAYCAAKDQKDIDAINPFLPSWYSKTDDRPNIWVSDTTEIPPEAKVALNVLLRDSTPPLNAAMHDLLCEFPTDDMDYLNGVALAMTRVAPLFAWDLGEGDNENFRWAPALCLIGGLSPAVLRVFADCMQHEEAWQFWRSASDEEIVKDILDARKISGYPVGLLRCDFQMVHRMFEGLTLQSPNGALVTPRWYKSMVALHIFKHARFYGGRSPAIFCAYRGHHNRVKLDPDALYQSMSSPENAAVAKLLCQTLGLPYNQTRNNRTWAEDAVADVLKMIQPLYLPEPRDATAYPEILVGPAVRFGVMRERRSAHGWVRPQIAVTGIARLDYGSASIETNAVITDAMIFNVRWPEGAATQNEIANWRLSLPTTVYPARFSSVVGKRLRNWNKMGFDEGADAVLDATVTVDLFRDCLAGSLIGAALTLEFPLVFILPVGSTTEDTTNQGKTSMARIIGEALVPGLGKNVIMATTSTSPPAMRSVAEPLYRFGTAIYDEFLVPDSSEHFLGQAGLQNLASGGTATPGRALENDPGIKLKHPVFFAAKLVKNVKDLQNRMVPLFLDTLTDATRCSPEELAEITGGRASIQARWCHLLWCHQNNIQSSLAVATPIGGVTWRFPGHLTAALMFAADSQILGYLATCAEYCSSQIARAEESGLADNIGLNAGFDPRFFFLQMHSETTDRLKMICEGENRHLEILDALLEIVEDGGRRKFNTALRGCSEASAKHRFIEMFKRAKNSTLSLHGTDLTWVSSERSHWKPNGDAKAYITARKSGS